MVPGEHFESGSNALPGSLGVLVRAYRKPSELDLDFGATKEK